MTRYKSKRIFTICNWIFNATKHSMWCIFFGQRLYGIKNACFRDVFFICHPALNISLNWFEFSRFIWWKFHSSTETAISQINSLTASEAAMYSMYSVVESETLFWKRRKNLRKSKLIIIYSRKTIWFTYTLWKMYMFLMQRRMLIYTALKEKKILDSNYMGNEFHHQKNG